MMNQTLRQRRLVPLPPPQPIDDLAKAHVPLPTVRIETPDPEALKKTGNRQNVCVDMRAAIDEFTAAGVRGQPPRTAPM